MGMYMYVFSPLQNEMSNLRKKNEVLEEQG